MANEVSKGATVTVGCKLPHGIILHLYDMVDVDIQVMGGGVKTVKQAQRRTDVEVRINGNAVVHGRAPQHQIVGRGGEFTDGVALTAGVPKDVWDQWLAANKHSDVVRNGLIFACESHQRAVDQARDHSQKRSGLEPLAQDKDPRAPRGSRTSLGSVADITAGSRKD